MTTPSVGVEGTIWVTQASTNDTGHFYQRQKKGERSNSTQAGADGGTGGHPRTGASGHRHPKPPPPTPPPGPPPAVRDAIFNWPPWRKKRVGPRRDFPIARFLITAPRLLGPLPHRCRPWSMGADVPVSLFSLWNFIIMPIIHVLLSPFCCCAVTSSDVFFEEVLKIRKNCSV